MNREITKVTKGLLSEWKLQDDEWVKVLPIVQYALNHRWHRIIDTCDLTCAKIRTLHSLVEPSVNRFPIHRNRILLDGHIAGLTNDAMNLVGVCLAKTIHCQTAGPIPNPIFSAHSNSTATN